MMRRTARFVQILICECVCVGQKFIELLTGSGERDLKSRTNGILFILLATSCRLPSKLCSSLSVSVPPPRACVETHPKKFTIADHK